MIFWTIVIVLAIFVAIFYLVTIYNGFVSLRNNYKKAWANIDVSLKQRNDELPNLVEIVKGYMKHEKKTLLAITQARADMMKTTDIQKKAKYSNQISAAVKTIFAVAEKYPKLQASDNFLKLQNRISGLENAIADRRELYNDSVNNYNIRIQSFPDLFMAKLFKFMEEKRFVASEDEKKVVKVDVS